MPPVRVSYYSDILCIWAYAAQRRIDQLAERFGEDVAIEAHFCSVFSDARAKIEDRWRERDSFEGFNRHLRDVALKFPHIAVHDRLWLENKPRSSASAHLFVKAIELIERDGNETAASPLPYRERLSTRAAWAMRRAFFEEALDISDWTVHGGIADGLGVDYALIEERIRSSEAIARLVADYDLSHKQSVTVSPTLIMNEDRQKLTGNVGYRLIEANVEELLRAPSEEEASWC